MRQGDLVLATWIIRAENELLKNRLPMLHFSLQMALRQAYKTTAAEGLVSALNEEARQQLPGQGSTAPAGG
jgi:hypothetical protein